MERLVALILCFAVPCFCKCVPTNSTPEEIDGNKVLRDCLDGICVESIQVDMLELLFSSAENLTTDQLIGSMRPILGPEKCDMLSLCFVSKYFKAIIECTDNVELTTLEKDKLRRNHMNLYEAIASTPDFPELLEKTIGKERAEKFKGCGLMASMFGEV